MLDCNRGAVAKDWLPGLCETGGVLKMPPLIFHKWKMQGLVSSPPSVPAVFVYSAYFFLIIHLKTLSHQLMLLCHSPVSELSMTRKRWRKMRCRCGYCLNIPLQCRCCWGAKVVNLTLLLHRACIHQSVNLIFLLFQPTCPHGTACSMYLHPPWSFSMGAAHLAGATGNTGTWEGLESVVQLCHVWVVLVWVLSENPE